MTAPTHHIMYLAAFLFATGITIVIVKRNAILVLMGIELMLNASNLNLVVFNQNYPLQYEGHLFALFVIIIAVSEAAVGLAIVLRVYKYYQSSAPDEIADLKG